MSFINTAHARMMADLAKLGAPDDLFINTSADEFLCRKVHLQKFFATINEYVSAHGIDLAEHSKMIDAKEYQAAVMDAAHDRGLFAMLTDAADELRVHDHAADRADHHYKSMREAV